MKRFLLAGVVAFVPSLFVQGLLATAGHAQDTVKIGVVMPYSGQFADPTTQGDNGIKLYLKQHGGMLAGKKVELIRKDVGGINPPIAKRLAQELVTRDNVDHPGRLSTDTERSCRRRRFRRSQKVHGGYERGDRHHHHQVAVYGARLIHHPRSSTKRLRTWAAQKHGLKNAYIMVTDYGPGIDAEAAFQKGFKESWRGDRRRRCAWRCGVRISRPMCSAPRISIRKAFSS